MPNNEQLNNHSARPGTTVWCAAFDPSSSDTEWVAIGYTDEDGIIIWGGEYPVQQADPVHISTVIDSLRDRALADVAGRPAPDPAPDGAGSILEAIDAAVAAATPPPMQRCGCGCGRTLSPDGPSEHFAGPGCQRRWHAQQVNDPDDVYTRPDANDTNLDLDEPSPYAHIQFHDGPDEPVALVLRPPCADPRGAAYRRHCGACGQTTIPTVYEPQRERTPPFDARGPLLTAAAVSRTTCGNCDEDLPGPVYVPSVHDDERSLLMVLHDGCSRASRRFTHRHLDRVRSQAQVFDSAWRDLERQLDEFRGSFLGSGQGP